MLTQSLRRTRGRHYIDYADFAGAAQSAAMHFQCRRSAETTKETFFNPVFRIGYLKVPSV